MLAWAEIRALRKSDEHLLQPLFDVLVGADSHALPRRRRKGFLQEIYLTHSNPRHRLGGTIDFGAEAIHREQLRGTFRENAIDSSRHILREFAHPL